MIPSPYLPYVELSSTKALIVKVVSSLPWQNSMMRSSNEKPGETERVLSDEDLHSNYEAYTGMVVEPIPPSSSLISQDNGCMVRLLSFLTIDSPSIVFHAIANSSMISVAREIMQFNGRSEG